MLSAAILCVSFSTVLAATVEWHVIGSPPSGSPAPSSLVISPAIPAITNTISFVAPAGTDVYLNSIAAADAAGNPLISVDSTNHTVTVNFTARLDEPIPEFALLVSGVDGQFGPLAAGTWGFLVYSNSGALIYSNTFKVAGPPLAIVLSGNQAVLSWPVLGSNYVLQTTTDISSGSWSNVTNGIARSGSNYVFTNAVRSQDAYFRGCD